MPGTEITAEQNRHGYAAMARRLQRGEAVAPFEITRITKSGEPKTIWLHVSALVDEKHRPVKFATFERPVNR